MDWGVVLFFGTRAHPVISFKEECDALQRVGHNIRLCHTDLVEQEREILTKRRDATNLVSPEIHELPHLPTWAVHNWWDYWGRPYAYIDAPSGHADVGVSSALAPPLPWVMVAVLVNCPHKLQYLSDQSASAVTRWARHQARALNQSGGILPGLQLDAPVQ